MKVEFNTLCRYAEHADGGRFVSIMSGGLSGYNIPSFPFPCPPTYHVCRLLYLPEECQNGRQYRIRTVMLSPEKKQILDFGEEVLTPVLTPKSRNAVTTTITALSGYPFKEAGEYVFEVFVDDKSTAKCSLWITLISQEKTE